MITRLILIIISTLEILRNSSLIMLSGKLLLNCHHFICIAIMFWKPTSKIHCREKKVEKGITALETHMVWLFSEQCNRIPMARIQIHHNEF